MHTIYFGYNLIYVLFKKYELLRICYCIIIAMYISSHGSFYNLKLLHKYITKIEFKNISN